MKQQVRNRITSLLSLLSAEQKEKEIIEIDETNDEKLVAFLKNDGLLTFDYEIEYENFKPQFLKNQEQLIYGTRT